MAEAQMCAECGAFDDQVHHVDLTWPNGRHYELWLHPKCEAACQKRIEDEMKVQFDPMQQGKSA